MKRKFIVIAGLLCCIVVVTSIFICLNFNQSDTITIEACILEVNSLHTLTVYQTQEVPNRLCHIQGIIDAEIMDESGEFIDVDELKPGDLIKIEALPLVQYLGIPIYPQTYEIRKIGLADEALMSEGFNKLRAATQ